MQCSLVCSWCDCGAGYPGISSKKKEISESNKVIKPQKFHIRRFGTSTVKTKHGRVQIEDIAIDFDVRAAIVSTCCGLTVWWYR